LVDACLVRLDLLRQVLLEVLLLAVHVGADRAAGNPAADRAEQHGPRVARAVGDRAQDGAARRAEHDACLGVRPVDLRTAAIGSTAGEYQCRYYELVQT